MYACIAPHLHTSAQNQSSTAAFAVCNAPLDAETEDSMKARMDAVEQYLMYVDCDDIKTLERTAILVGGHVLPRGR